jgi:hypothetical protein
MMARTSMCEVDGEEGEGDEEESSRARPVEKERLKALVALYITR